MRGMVLGKTDKGRREMAPGVRTLGQRARTFLLLVDGNRSLEEIEALLHGDTDSLTSILLKDGFVCVVDGEQLGNPLTSKSAQKLGIQELE